MEDHRKIILNNGNIITSNIAKELTRKFILQQMGIGVDRFKYLVKKYDKSQK